MTDETLRSATLVLSGALRPRVFERIDDSSAVSLPTTRYLGPVEDGQYVGLSDLRGDLAAARSLFAESDDVVRYDVAGSGGRGIVYAHYRTVGPVEELLTLLYENDVVLEWPVEHRRRGRGSVARFSIIGTSTGIKQAATGLPDGVDLTLEQIGRYDSGGGERSVLTDTQSALLDLAVQEGYYEVPRETTQRALADRLGVTTATVSDRLQRIERRVMTAHYAGSSE